MKRQMINAMRALCLGSVAVVCLMSAPAQAQMAPAKAPGDAPKVSKMAAVEVRMAMRQLWEEHIVYTRNYIISAVADLPDASAVAGRLLKNQDDIGNAIKPFYGDAAGNKLTALLRDHILTAVDVINAAKAGDKAQLTDTLGKWSANGKEIAAFLSGANPNWSKKTLEAMLQKHLDLTTGEVVGRLNKDWAADIKSYDEGHAHMLMFADTLTMGIAKQFPAKFK